MRDLMQNWLVGEEEEEEEEEEAGPWADRPHSYAAQYSTSVATFNALPFYCR